MKQITAYTFSLFCLLLVLSSCSRKNDSFINRNLHAIGTEFNTLYNGNLALQAGLDNIENNYQDNYWSILPVERLTVKDAIRVSGDEQSDPNFERAEEKAVKAVQKHSMQIDGEEVNPQIDEAYMLLGKARYYDQRFIPSLEAFNYILQFMPESDQIRRAKIWREKTNMRLENNEIAIENLQNLIKEDSLEIDREELILANATLAQAYLNVNKIDSALIYMNKAAQKTKDKAIEGRYKFIAGQLFAAAGQKDSAIAHFDEVIELHRKIPRNYYVRAFIEKIKLRDTLQQSDAQMLTFINELEANRENRPWLDIINYQKALFLESIDSIDGAVAYYNKSLRAGDKDRYLKGLTYDALGRVNFDNARFETAGTYFDSAATQYEDRTREKRAAVKKKENLADVILYETTRRNADSILNVVAMTDEQREVFYSNYIEELKAREEALAEQAALNEANLAQQKTASATIATSNNRNRMGPPGAPIDNAGSLASTPTDFYFYIPTTVARGKLQFRAIWGNRPLEDNWRLAVLSSNEKEDDLSANQEDLGAVTLAPEYQTSYYINQLPVQQTALDSIADARDFAYYQLGVLYKEKFKRNDLAVDRFEKLLTYDPEEKLLLPTLYNLYLIEQETEGSGTVAVVNADQYKNTIINEYPETRYAQILQNPTGPLDNSESATGVYNKIFKLFEQEQFATVIQQTDEQITRFAGDPIVPKMELLKTFASGRLYGYKVYKEGLDFIALNYPNSEAGQEAAAIAAQAETAAIPNAFTSEEESTQFKLLYIIKANDDKLIQQLQEQLARPINALGNNITYSIDVYSPRQSLVVIHGMNSKSRATQVAEYLADPSHNITALNGPPVTISSNNYKIVQVHKSLNEYLNTTL